MGHSRRRRTVADADGWQHEEVDKAKRDQSAGGARDGAALAATASDHGGKGGGKSDHKAMRARMGAAALAAKREYLESLDAAYRRGRANPWNGCRDRPDTAQVPGSDKSKKGKGKG